MITKKATLKELKEMDQFEAVNRKGVRATFRVNAEDETAVATYENGETREMKLDSVRRSWMVVVNNKEEEEEMRLFVPGVKVKDTHSNREGVVREVIGKLATVEMADGEDFAANTDNLIALNEEREYVDENGDVQKGEPKKGNVVKFEQPEVDVEEEAEDSKPEEKPEVENKERPKQSKVEGGKSIYEEEHGKEKLARIPATGRVYREEFHFGDDWSFHRVVDEKSNFISAKFMVHGEEVKLRLPSKKRIRAYLKENLGIEVTLRNARK